LKLEEFKTVFKMVNLGSKHNYDIVIFGASGYTGQYVIEYVYKAVEQGTDISFGDTIF